MTRKPFRVGVLASGAGTNLQALLDHVHGRDGIELVAVASNRSEAPALERARRAGVPAAVFEEVAFSDRAARDAAMAAWLRERAVALVVLAGYMQLLAPAFLAHWPDRVINVHPALLPAFPGVRAIEQCLAYGVKVAGVTVHLVDEGVDSGAIIAQAAIDVPEAYERDALHEALRPHEHRLLCAAVRAIAAGRVRRDPDHPRRVLVGAPVSSGAE